MTYSIQLTDREICSLETVARRGYATVVLEAYKAAKVWEPLCADRSKCFDAVECLNCHCDVRFEIPESLAWEIREEEESNGGHGFGPVVPSLAAKLYALLDSIV